MLPSMPRSSKWFLSFKFPHLNPVPFLFSPSPSLHHPNNKWQEAQITKCVIPVLYSGVLGIPFLDVVRVLAAVLLLGNVQFVDGQGLEVDVKGDAELKAVASLLGVSGVSLFRGLTSRTHNARGQLVKSVCDANMVSCEELTVMMH